MPRSFCFHCVPRSILLEVYRLFHFRTVFISMSNSGLFLRFRCSPVHLFAQMRDEIEEGDSQTA